MSPYFLRIIRNQIIKRIKKRRNTSVGPLSVGISVMFTVNQSITRNGTRNGLIRYGTYTK